MSANKIFISYSRSDSDFTNKLTKHLSESGVDVWIDHKKIQAGNRWDQSIEEALDQSSTILVVLSPASIKSENVMDEVNYALEENKQIVPILYQKCKVPLRLRRIQWIDFIKGFESGLTQLKEALDVADEPADNSGNTLLEEFEMPLLEAPLKVPRIFPENSDDPAFLLMMDRILTAEIATNWPDNVYLIRIDNWFDNKWLKFSGLADSGSEGYKKSKRKLKEFHLDEVTVPPFNPNRVISQNYFEKNSKGLYLHKRLKSLVHPKKKMSSAKNLQRKIRVIAQSDAFCWFSSNSAQNRNGAFMLYRVNEDVLPWYGSFIPEKAGHKWKVDKVKGISAKELTSIISD